MTDVRTRFDLQPDRDPDRVVQPDARHREGGHAAAAAASPQTKEPIGPDDLAPLFPMALIGQEVSTDEWIDIPGEVIDVYRLWRPSPLFRATRLEQALDTPARIYFKYEGVSPAGSHKPNTAVPQAFYNKQAGIRRIATETGAGQWGSAMAHGLPDVRPRVRRVHGEGVLRPEAVPADLHGDLRRQRRGLAERQDEQRSRDPRRRTPIRPVRSASRSARPSRTPRRTTTRTTRSAACWATCCCTRSVIGLEAQKQMEMAGERPDVVVGCVGGGSNYAGIAYPFMAGKLARRDARHAVPRDRAGRVPDPHEGPVRLRLRRHGADRADRADVHARPRLRAGAGARRWSALPRRRAVAVAAGARGPHGRRRPTRRTRSSRPRCTFAKAQGILPAPEPSHAIKGAIDEASRRRKPGRSA